MVVDEHAEMLADLFQSARSLSWSLNFIPSRVCADLAIAAAVTSSISALSSMATPLLMASCRRAVRDGDSFGRIRTPVADMSAIADLGQFEQTCVSIVTSARLAAAAQEFLDP